MPSSTLYPESSALPVWICMLENVLCILQRAANTLAVGTQAPSYDCPSEVAREGSPRVSIPKVIHSQHAFISIAKIQVAK